MMIKKIILAIRLPKYFRHVLVPLYLLLICYCSLIKVSSSSFFTGPSFGYDQKKNDFEMFFFNVSKSQISFFLVCLNSDSQNTNLLNFYRFLFLSAPPTFWNLTPCSSCCIICLLRPFLNLTHLFFVSSTLLDFLIFFCRHSSFGFLTRHFF